MPSRKSGEYRAGGQTRVLLVGADPSSRDSISTLLNTMGWACVAVSSYEDVPAAIERELFDAVLLHLADSARRSEQTIRIIKQIRPSLAEKIVVISGETIDRQTLELIERQDLPHLPQQHLISTLWATLEDLFLPGGIGKVTPSKPRMARLLFDSFRFPLPSGVRSSGTSGRHLTYEHSNTIIDLLVDRPAGSELISLIGQVLDATKLGRRNFGLPVVLLNESVTLARTTTNHLGEFNLQFKYVDNINLEIKLGQQSWVSIPLGEPMSWVKKEVVGRARGM